MIRIPQHLFCCDHHGDQENAMQIQASTNPSKTVLISWLTRKEAAKCVSDVLVRK